MDNNTSHSILARIKEAKEKKANDPSTEAFGNALQQMSANQLKTDAFGDVRNMGLAALGAGVAGRGLMGLIQTIRSNRAKKTRSGPAYLPLPFPAKAANFLEGDNAASKAGIPWYGPAMLLGGLGGLGLGWKGMDAVLNKRRERAIKGEMETAKQEFHDALLSQYDEPVKMHPQLLSKKAEDANTMTKVGAALDELFDTVQTEINKQETRFTKKAFDFENLAGAATGGYGMYAGLSGLLAGAVTYNKMQKRSRRAILDKALQRRQRRKFMQSPSEIYAVPEAVPAPAAVAG